jgi:hypothetical protein
MGLRLKDDRGKGKEVDDSVGFFGFGEVVD